MYKPSTLEKWISDILIKKNIMYPWELQPHLIAEAFNIDYNVLKSPAISGEEFGESYIIVDARKDSMIQREQFFHELGHILRHDGDQRNGMTESFRTKQEWDAHLFTGYAMIPYHMLDFSQQYTEDTLVERFNVPLYIARKRIEQICIKIFDNKKTIKRQFETKTFNLEKCSKETKRIIAQLKKQIEATK